ncbi:MAG TPA: hypothetical protein VJS65_05275, partial [Verrucomicrobiae bacterium]|nr:hypothetical protein [Verrucomicrobiae bacterium]
CSWLKNTRCGSRENPGLSMGNNPVVVMVPFGGLAGSGNIMVFAVGPGGGSNILGQFPVPALPA